jgi:hypothetical protein
MNVFGIAYVTQISIRDLFLNKLYLAINNPVHKLCLIILPINELIELVKVFGEEVW